VLRTAFIQPSLSTLTFMPSLGRRRGLGLIRTTSSVPIAAKRNLLRISIKIILNSSADHTLPRHCLGPWENAAKAYGSIWPSVHLLGLNWSASSPQMCGLRWMMAGITVTVVSLGMRIPSMTISSTGCRGVEIARWFEALAIELRCKSIAK